MARKRMLDPQFWGDKNINKLTIAARYMFLGIISNADDDGYIEAELSQLKRLIFGFDFDKDVEIEEAYNQLKSYKNLHFYEVDGDVFAHLVNWEEYQTQREERRVISKLPKCTVCQMSDTRQTNVSHMSDTSQSDVRQVTAQDKVSKGKVSKLSKGKLSQGKEVVTAGAATKFAHSKQFQQADEFFSSLEMQQKLLTWLVQIKGLKESYAKNELQAFIDYWTAETKSGRPVWETKKTFMLKGRLVTWFKNQFRWDNERVGSVSGNKQPKGKNYG